MARKLLVVDDQTESRDLITMVPSTEDHVIRVTARGEPRDLEAGWAAAPARESP